MRRRRRYHLGPAFWIYCLLMILVALVAVNGGFNLLFWIFGAMMAGLIVSGIISGGMMMRLGAARLLPDHAVAGRPVVLRYRVRHAARLLPAFGIFVDEAATGRDRPVAVAAPAWIMHVGPGETVHGEACLPAPERGVLRFGAIRLWTTFPFGFVRKSVEIEQPQRLLVFPRILPLRPDAMRLVAPPGTVGQRVTAHAGAGDDFYGLREHRPGDGLRHIAWKRTANRDNLLCIERTRPNPPRLRVVIDLRTPTAELAVAPGEPFDGRALEETAISLAASLVHAAERQGFEVGLSVLGPAIAPIPVRRHPRHGDRIMAALAEIDLDAPRSGGPRSVAPEAIGEHAATVVVHPDRADLAVSHGRAIHFTARQRDRLVIGAAPGGEAA